MEKALNRGDNIHMTNITILIESLFLLFVLLLVLGFGVDGDCLFELFGEESVV